MAQKKLMLLGGLRYLLPVIEAAHQQGYYVITADYLPDNIAHKYSDEYCNVSIIDKESVLAKARELQIDGIMSFACDPGVVAASYVQNQMGLPSFGPFESVEILQNKDKFRAFLKEHGFNVPWAFGFASKEEAWESRQKFSYPLIVKPTDSAGSKGCTRVDNEKELMEAIEYAFKYTISGHIIIEEFLEKRGCSSDTDSYSYNGELKFVSFCAQRFDANAVNPYTPAAYSWPSTFTKEEEDYLTSEIQRLITLLGMKTSVFNIETRVSPNGKPYIMELTPRGGGNRLCEMLRYATGVDMITAITRAMVGDEPELIDQKPYNGHWAEIILHADKDGEFQGLQINPSLPAEVVEEDLWVKPGDFVHGFEAANDAIGTLVLRFETEEELDMAINNQEKWLKVKVKNMMRLAIIGASIGQLPICLKAKELGLETHCFAWEQGAVCKDVVDFFYPISITEKDKIVEKCRELQIDGVVSNASELTSEISSHIAEKLELNGTPSQVLEKLHDKYYVRKISEKIDGLSSPMFYKYEGSDKGLYPCIVKPCGGSAKKGVSFVNDPQSFKTAINYARESSLGEIIVEEFISGKELSVESISYKGVHHVIQITDKDSSSAPHFVELGHHQPADITPSLQSKIKKVIPNLLSSIGYTNGASHIEIKYRDEEIYLIEVNLRGGGDEISNKLVMMSSGVDYLRCMIEVALNIFQTPVQVTPPSYAGIYYLCKQTESMLPFFEGAKDKDWYVEGDIYNRKLKESHSNYERDGYLIYKWKKKVIPK